MQIILLLTGILIGFVIAWFISKNKNLQADAALKQQFSDAEKENAKLLERANNQHQTIEQLNSSLNAEREKVTSLSESNARLETLNQTLNKNLQEQKAELENINARLKTEFENLANNILEKKSEKFTQQNKDNLDIILNPLKEKIKEFEEKVDKTYKAESTERISLKEQIKNLLDLNKQLSDDANNLARALKGDVKKQGNWGEIILEKILERSGLVKDETYKTQVNFTNEDGKRSQPDIIVYLPDNKHLVIDSKVSLLAYDGAMNAITDEERETFIKDHIFSVRNHVKLLSEKNYHLSPGLDSPDFVILFMYSEAAFSLAVQNDNELWGYGWDRKIVIVSPTTLLATLRTISSIWKQERQTRNAMEIADRAGKLYDKFVGFSEDLLKVGHKIIDTKKVYDDAMKKLSEGSGNLVSSVEKLRELGAKNSKQLPANLVERAEEND
jgi:DNA recombination protein RmuC